MNTSMNTRVSRRTLVAVAGASALSAGLVRSVAASAQQRSSPYTFSNGPVLTWEDPWVLNDDNYVTDIVANSETMNGGAGGQLLLGYFDAPASIDDIAKGLIAFLLTDPSLAKNVAGGSEQSVGAGGVLLAQKEHRVYSYPYNNEDYGFYIQLVDQMEVAAIFAPVAVFASELASAQSLVKIDDVGVLGGVDGAEVQEQLGGGAAETTSEEPASTAPEGGQYTIPTGTIDVTWSNGWTVVSQNEVGTELANPAKSIVLAVAGIAFDGKDWQQAADAEVTRFAGDQGAAETSGPEVTDGGFSFSVKGQYGLVLVEGIPTDDAAVYGIVYVMNFPATGADAVALIEDAQASVQVNGSPALQNVAQFIPA